MTANEGASVLCVQYGPACVELKFADGSMISIDCTAVEDEVAKNIYQRSELDYLIYNKSLEYAQIALGGVGEVYPRFAGTSFGGLNKIIVKQPIGQMIGGLFLSPNVLFSKTVSKYRCCLHQ